MPQIIPPSPIDAPFGSYGWADWYEKVRRAINNATSTITVAQGGTGITSYTTGDILYASATNVLSKLPVGANGRVLTVAAGLPSWAPSATTAGGGIPTSGRLTLSSGIPVTQNDVIGATNIYFTPYNGNQKQLWDGSAWTSYTFTETTLALGVLVSATNYDIYAYQSASVLTLDTPLAWRNSGQAITGATTATPIVITTGSAHGLSTGDEAYVNSVLGLNANGLWTVTVLTATTFSLDTSVGVGAYTAATGWFNARVGTTKPSLQDGRYCKTGDKTRLYLGTFRTTSTTTTEDSQRGEVSQTGGKRFLWNYYNRVLRSASVFDGTNTWAYNTGTVRQANAAAGNKVEFVTGIAEDSLQASVTATVFNGATVGSDNAAPGIDLTTQMFGQIGGGLNNSATQIYSSFNSIYRGPICAGYHTIYWNEKGSSAGTNTWIGDNGGTGFDGANSGLSISITA
jgi:hypothetical protein